MNFLIVFIIFVSVAFIQIAAEECQLRNKCECVQSDGSGISLKQLVDGVDFVIAGSDQRSSQNVTFYFHPCGDTTSLPSIDGNITNNCKNGYSLCKFNNTSNYTQLDVIGSEKDMSIKRDADGEYRILYTRSPGTSESSETSIMLECTPNAKKSVLYVPTDFVSKGQINLTLFSKYACVTQIDVIEHRGFFYTFFIIILTLAFAYLSIGMLMNYFFIGARGYELIPNYDFWKKVWLSIRLGFIYIKNGCRVIPSGEDSYDAI